MVNIKFTMEIKEKNTLNFLDIKIKKHQNLSFSTSTFHKETLKNISTKTNNKDLILKNYHFVTLILQSFYYLKLGPLNLETYF